MPATTTGFSDYLYTKWQKVLVSKGGKERPLLYPRAMRVQDMDVNPYLAVKLSGMGVMQAKAEGQQFPSDAPITGGNFSVTANPFGQLFSVTYEMWRDDRYGVMDQMWFDMRKSCRYRQEVQAWAGYNNAFSVATGYDATDLCSTSHVDLDGTIQSNRPSPDVVLSTAAIQAGQLNFRLLNDDRSRPAEGEPTRLVYHPTEIPLVRDLIGSSGAVQSANNDMNTLVPDNLYGLPARYLTRTLDWFLCLPVEESDMIFMWRDRPIARNFDDPFTMDADFTLYIRVAQFIGDWRWIYGSTTGV